jgi:hypothetical protein
MFYVWQLQEVLGIIRCDSIAVSSHGACPLYTVEFCPFAVTQYSDVLGGGILVSYWMRAAEVHVMITVTWNQILVIMYLCGLLCYYEPCVSCSFFHVSVCLYSVYLLNIIQTSRCDRSQRTVPLIHKILPYNAYHKWCLSSPLNITVVIKLNGEVNGGDVAHMGKKSNAWKILMRKPEGKRLCKRLLGFLDFSIIRYRYGSGIYPSFRNL